MAVIDLRDPETQKLYLMLGDAFGRIGTSYTPSSRQSETILGQQKNAAQLNLLQDTASKLDPQHQQEFLTKNAALFAKLGSPLGTSITTPEVPPSDQSVQDYISKALAERFPQASANPAAGPEPLRTFNANQSALSELPNLQAEAKTALGTPAVLGKSVNLPFDMQQLSPDLKGKIGKGAGDNVRNKDIFKAGGADWDTLFKTQTIPTNSLLNMAGVAKIKPEQLKSVIAFVSNNPFTDVKTYTEMSDAIQKMGSGQLPKGASDPLELQRQKDLSDKETEIMSAIKTTQAKGGEMSLTDLAKLRTDIDMAEGTFKRLNAKIPDEIKNAYDKLIMESGKNNMFMSKLPVMLGGGKYKEWSKNLMYNSKLADEGGNKKTDEKSKARAALGLK